MTTGNSEQLAHEVTVHAVSLLACGGSRRRENAADGGAGGFAKCESASQLDALAGVAERMITSVGERCMKAARHAGRQQANVVDTLLVLSEMEGHAEDGDGETVESLLSFLRAAARDEAQGGGGDASTSTSQLPYVVPQFPIDVDEVDIYDQDTGDLLPTPSQENVDGKDGDGARGGHAHTDAKRFLLATFKDKDTDPPAHIPAFMPSFPPAHTYGATPTFNNQDRGRASKRDHDDVEMAPRPAPEADLAEQNAKARAAERKLAAAMAAATDQEMGKTESDRDEEFLRAVAQRRNLYSLASTAAREPADTNPFLEPPGLIHDGRYTKYHYSIPEPAINKMLQSLYDDEKPETGVDVHTRAPSASIAGTATLIGATGLGKSPAGDAQHRHGNAILNNASFREFTKKVS